MTAAATTVAEVADAGAAMTYRGYKAASISFSLPKLCLGTRKSNKKSSTGKLAKLVKAPVEFSFSD